MALILALNPGNRHSPTLSRLARELRGCELMGAESCPVAIKAIKKRVPDVLLLPAASTPGEAELMTHLKTIPGGVLTLKLPPVESADPVDLARQIRELLTGVPASAPPAATKVQAPSAPARMQAPPPAVKTQAPPAPAPARVQAPPAPEIVPMPVGASPELLAAATATAGWIRARQAQWSEPWVEVPHPPLELKEPDEPEHTYELYEPIELAEGEPDPFALEATPEAEETRSNVGSLLPRVAAIAAVAGVLGAVIFFWPQMRRTFGGSEAPSQISSEPPPAAAVPDPVASQPAAPPPAEPAAATDAPNGTVAVVLPFEITITEDNKPVALDDQRRAVLAPGKHRLRFQNVERGYDATRTVQVRPNETTTLTLTPETTLAVTSNEPAEVLVDGVRAGETPYEGKLGLGPHTVTVKTSGAERQLSVDATSKPVQLEVDFSKP